MNYMVDHEIANFENGIQEGKFTVEEAIEACFEASFCKDLIKKYTKLVSEITATCNTLEKFGKEMSKLLALAEVDQQRIDFLLNIKKEASDNKALCNAIDAIIDKINSPCEAITLQTIDSAATLVTKNAWSGIKKGVLPLEALDTAASALDQIFNTNDTATNNIKLLMMYTVEQYAQQTVIKSRSAYDSSDEESAAAFNANFTAYLNYQEFVSDWTKNWVSDALLEGWFNDIKNLFSDKSENLYHDWENRLNYDASFCQRVCELTEKFKNLYNTAVNAKSVFDGTTTPVNASKDNVEENQAKLEVIPTVYTINKDITLNGNMAINGDAFISANINLNGYTLTINGDLVQTNGEMHIGGGTLNVNGSYTVSDTGVLCMCYENDDVNVGKDFTIKNNVNYYSKCYNSGSSYKHFSAGIISIGGNLYQYNGKTETENFKSTNNHIVKFVGSGVHEIYLESPYSYIGELSVPNNAKVKFTGYFTGIRANQDLTVTGDLTLYKDSAFDLNGSTLTIEGDFTQDGKINLNCGTLNINGDYKSNNNIYNNGYQESVVNVNKNMSLTGGTSNLNSITMNVNGDLTQTNGEMHIGGGTLNVNGSYTVSDTGVLCMCYENDDVNVGKDFIIKNNVNYYSKCYNSGSSYKHFSTGIISIGGNFYQYNGKTETENFKSTNNHIVKFVGSGVHKINSESPNTSMHDIILTDGASISFNGSFGGFSTISSCTFSSSKPTVAKISGNTVQSVSAGYATLKIDDKSSIELTVEEVVTGDANGDGELTIADAVILQKWLLAVPHVRLANWEACDLCKDGRIDVFDLCLLKRKLINS